MDIVPSQRKVSFVIRYRTRLVIDFGEMWKLVEKIL